MVMTSSPGLVGWVPSGKIEALEVEKEYEPPPPSMVTGSSPENRIDVEALLAESLRVPASLPIATYSPRVEAEPITTSESNPPRPPENSIPSARLKGTEKSTVSVSSPALVPKMVAFVTSQTGRDSRGLKKQFYLVLLLQLEDFFNLFAEGAPDAEGQGQGRGVAALLGGDDGLAGDADGLGQLLLGHLSRLKPQPANIIGELFFTHLSALVLTESALSGLLQKLQ